MTDEPEIKESGVSLDVPPHTVVDLTNPPTEPLRVPLVIYPNGVRMEIGVATVSNMTPDGRMDVEAQITKDEYKHLLSMPPMNASLESYACEGMVASFTGLSLPYSAPDQEG